MPPLDSPCQAPRAAVPRLTIPLQPRNRPIAPPLSARGRTLPRFRTAPILNVRNPVKCLQPANKLINLPSPWLKRSGLKIISKKVSNTSAINSPITRAPPQRILSCPRTRASFQPRTQIIRLTAAWKHPEKTENKARLTG